MVKNKKKKKKKTKTRELIFVEPLDVLPLHYIFMICFNLIENFFLSEMIAEVLKIWSSLNIPHIINLYHILKTIKIVIATNIMLLNRVKRYSAIIYDLA